MYRGAENDLAALGYYSYWGGGRRPRPRPVRAKRAPTIRWCDCVGNRASPRSAGVHEPVQGSGLDLLRLERSAGHGAVSVCCGCFTHTSNGAQSGVGQEAGAPVQWIRQKMRHLGWRSSIVTVSSARAGAGAEGAQPIRLCNVSHYRSSYRQHRDRSYKFRVILNLV